MSVVIILALFLAVVIFDALYFHIIDGVSLSPVAETLFRMTATTLDFAVKFHDFIRRVLDFREHAIRLQDIGFTLMASGLAVAFVHFLMIPFSRSKIANRPHA